MDLLSIKDPTFLKNLNQKELIELAESIRSFLIENISKTGGHLSSNLGIVELTIALHKVFDSPVDKLIFDVGHQSYTHKILTGRAKDFTTLRKYKGLSGFIKTNESIHDVWEAGHSSTALAALAGFEVAKSMNHETHKCVAVVGDGSLNSGLSFEALNFLGHQGNLAPIIILNDNEMSISKNVGRFAKLLNSMRANKTYIKASKTGNKFPYFFRDLKNRVGQMIRGFFKNTTIFDEFGYKYYGPIDGHNFKTLEKYLKLVKSLNQPIVLHVITKKGKGYSYAENDKIGAWHGVKPFNIETGEPLVKKAENTHSWSNIISEYLIKRAEITPELRVVVPAMISGSELFDFQAKYPDKIIDVGICESFAVCFSGALAVQKKPVFIPIYSSFLQRAYDQMSHDICRQNLHVIFGIDRAGVVGDDGDTHQGIYDIAYLRHMPNIIITQAKDPIEAYQLLDLAFDHVTSPFAIRYSNIPFQNFEYQEHYTYDAIEFGSWDKLTQNGSINLITYGDNVLRMAKLIEEKKLPINLYNARFIKPFDTKMIEKIVASNFKTFVLEDVTVLGGLGSSLLEFLHEKQLNSQQFEILGLPDQYIEQGKIHEIYQQYHLDNDSLLERFINAIK
ncbi:MAG: 1-deoxy-D-xylulose-5-phosphate synthase [Tenericutes bacterium HGW-Tenericutes-1]|nr:MAG: 1-deoxy-D-xylulose-5-phosphate synthase [Tenericutes bacterium HGW-Tenericutes-1]